MQLVTTPIFGFLQNHGSLQLLGYSQSNAQPLYLLMLLVLVAYCSVLNSILYMFVTTITQESVILALPRVSLLFYN